MYSIEALQVLLFLLPGFLSLKVLNSLAARDKETDLEQVVGALGFSFVVYGVYVLAYGKSPVVQSQEGTTLLWTIDRWSIVWLFMLSVIIPAFGALAINNDWLMRFARRLGITLRTSRQSVWQDIFLNKSNSYVEIRFSEGLTLYGWPEYWSDDPSQPFVYIRDPYWRSGAKYDRVGVEGMLVTPNMKIDYIQFLDREELIKEGMKRGRRQT